MPPPIARIVLVASVLLLAAAGGWWVLAGSGDPRADLVTAPNDTTTLPPSTTTASTTVPSTAPPTTVPAPGVPVGLVIPALGLDARVVPVGLEPDGSMEVPGASEAGWYLHGPRPGARQGTSVIAAHVDYGGQQGVFFRLRELQVGSEVLVTDDAGVVHRHVVLERYQVDKDELPIERIFVSGGEPGLTLITCGGAFDRGARSYEDNIVVRTAPAPA